MADHANTISTPDGPNPNRRGAIFYLSALVAGFALKQAILPTIDPQAAVDAEFDAIDAEIDVFRNRTFAATNDDDLNEALDGWTEAWGRFRVLQRKYYGA